VIEALESLLLLATLINGRPAPDPLDEFISFRLPLAADTTTHSRRGFVCKCLPNVVLM